MSGRMGGSSRSGGPSRGGSSRGGSSRGGGGGGGAFRGKRDRLALRGPRPSKFVISKDIKIDYKNLSFLQKFLSDRGKIVARRVTGASAKEQHKITQAIKQARYLGLLTTGGAKK